MKGFQTSSDLKRHKRTRVHQERVEQANGGKPPTEPAPADPESGEMSWQEDLNVSTASSASATTVAAAGAGPAGGGGTSIVTANVASEVNNTNSTAQALLSTITQPLAQTPVTVDAAAAGTVGVTFTTTAAAATVSGGNASTVDMKALGGGVATTWNNNTTAATTVAVANAGGPAAGVVTTVVQAGVPVTSAASTLDLKAISSGSTIDINALKWQNNGAAAPAPPVVSGASVVAGINATTANVSVAPPTASAIVSVAGNNLVAVTAPNAVAIAGPSAVAVAKRSSSLDSPGQDEERLTVVEGDDSSQDSVPAQQQASVS